MGLLRRSPELKVRWREGGREREREWLCQANQKDLLKTSLVWYSKYLEDELRTDISSTFEGVG